MEVIRLGRFNPAGWGFSEPLRPNPSSSASEEGVYVHINNRHELLLDPITGDLRFGPKIPSRSRRLPYSGEKIVAVIGAASMPTSSDRLAAQRWAHYEDLLILRNPGAAIFEILETVKMEDTKNASSQLIVYTNQLWIGVGEHAMFEQLKGLHETLPNRTRMLRTLKPTWVDLREV